MRRITLILLVFYCPWVWSTESIRSLGPQIAAKVFRASLFAETQVVRNRLGGNDCQTVFGLLTPIVMQGACGDAADYVAFSLVAQGISIEDLRLVGFGSRVSTAIPDVVVGRGVPGHVFTLLRYRDSFVIFDPTFFQFQGWKVIAALEKDPLGMEILRELRRFGFWVAGPKRWHAYLTAFSSQHRIRSQVAFEELPFQFDGFARFDFRRWGAPQPLQREDFLRRINSIGVSELRARAGDGDELPQFKLEPVSWPGIY